ncbi:Metabolite-proton symporter OS=Streptomyces albaduncus OX=68172 GN=FHS32_003088 PE=4 SV=1 [Streptomyces griseoloalbus]
MAPFIAVALWEAGDGSPWLVGVYLSSMALLTLVALLLGRETKDVGLEEGEAVEATARDDASVSVAP